MLGLELTLFNDILRFDYVLDSILCFWNGYFDIQMRTFSRPPNSPPQLSLFQMMYMILIVILGRGQKKIHLIIFRVETTPYSITIKLKKKLSNNIFFKSKYLQFVYFFLSEFNNKMGDDLQRHFFSGGVFLVITRKFKNIKI